MPFTLESKLQIAQTDPALIQWVFGNGPEAEDVYLYQRFGGDFFRYEEMLIDPQVGGKLDERVGALLGRAVLVDAASEEKGDVDAANSIKKILDIPLDPDKQRKKDKKKRPLIPYEQITGNFLNSALLIGFSVMAVSSWDERDGLILPSLELVPQRRFTFRYREPDNKLIKVCTDEDLDPNKEIVIVNGYELRLLTKRSPVEGERCPRNRFICYSYGSMKGLPHGLGLGYRIRKFYEIRREVLKSGVLTGDRLGSPPVHGTYPIDLNPKNQEDAIVLTAFNRLLKAISPNAHAATTDGFKINFLEPRAGGHTILKWLYETAALEISRAVWGEGSYSEKATGSYSAEQQQAENRNENVVDADCNSLDEGPLAALWSLIGEYNWPNAANPIVRRETESERRRLNQEQKEQEAKEAFRNGRVQSDRTLLLDVGLTTTDEYVKQTYGEQWTLPEQPTDEPAPDEPEEEPEEFAAHVDRFIDWSGVRVGLRYPPGSTRFPQHRSAKKLQSGYGFIQGYKVNGKAVRCYVHPGLLKDEPEGGDKIYAIAQLKNGEPDEDKLMVGYPSQEAAELAYRREMPPEFFGGIRPVTLKKPQYAEPDWEKFSVAEEDILDSYEDRLVRSLSSTYKDTLNPVRDFMEEINKGGGTDQEKYRKFVDGIYQLYGELDKDAIASTLGDGLAAGYFAGMYDERPDRGAVQFAEAEAVTDSATLSLIRSVYEKRLRGKVTKLVNVTLDDADNFVGEFQQYVSPRLTKRFTFTFGNGIVQFKSINADDIEKFSEETEDFATKRDAKNFKCKIAPCGGRCLKGGEACRQTMTPEERKAHATALRNKGRVDTSLAKKRREMKEARAAEAKAKEAAKTKEKRPRKTKENKSDTPDYKIDRSDHKAVMALGESFAQKHLKPILPSVREQKLYEEKTQLFTELNVARESGDTAALNKLAAKAMAKDKAYWDERKKRDAKEDEQAQVLKQALLSRHKITEKQAKEAVDRIPFSGLSEKEEKQVREDLEIAYRLSGGKGFDSLKAVTYTEERAYASRYGVINPGRPISSTTTFHELAHHMEYESKDTVTAAIAWRNERATSLVPEKLKDLVPGTGYADNEVALPGKYMQPYVGKVYRTPLGNENATEVTSTGIERFADNQETKSFYKENKDHFYFALGVLLSES